MNFFYRRIKPEKLELDDELQVLSVSSTPQSAHSNDEDDQDYIEVADKKNNKTIEVPLTDNKLDLKDLQDVYPGVEKLFLKFKDGRERLVKPKDGFFKAPPGGWKTVNVEVLRRVHVNQIFGCSGQLQHGEVFTNMPRKTHRQLTASDSDLSDENNEIEPETVKHMKLLNKTKPNDEDEEDSTINVKKIEKQESKNKYVFDSIENQDSSEPGPSPSKEDLAFYYGMNFSNIFNSPPFIFPFPNENGSDVHHRYNSFKNKILNNLRRTLIKIPYDQLLPKFIWKLRGIAVFPSQVETMLPGSAQKCQLCDDKFDFIHLFSIPHICAYQNTFNVDPPHILQICWITLQDMKNENDIQLKNQQ